jgi:transposase InsO family protein
MPWRDVSLVSQREEFVMLAVKEGSNMSDLCRRFGISRKTGYKWIERYRQEGKKGLCDLSRKPSNSPLRTCRETEKAVLRLRDEHPAWGGRKLNKRLINMGRPSPSPSTITSILDRNGRLNKEECEKHGPCRRFEHEEPNALWQMDFKGDFAVTGGGRCHALTIVDDHSRYSVCIKACANQRLETVREALTVTFRAYGLPERMLMDNGSCWGNDAVHRFTPLSAWLIRLGVGISHGRPYHPQTQGKNERFNRTLKAEVIGARSFHDLAQCQEKFDDWRVIYNIERPHEALGMEPPISRYRPSPRAFPENLPPVEYGPDDIVRKVHGTSHMYYKGRRFFLGHAFIGFPVAIRPTMHDDLHAVYFCHQRIGFINMREEKFYNRLQDDN